ncbi:hypothetical protein NCC78_11235 [Micromonospora phytophila]|uniref:hypothetical protein n=1 Tax=Micromonospora phytophila TaxID=709888 RepID=UPI00202E265E|nr:hypothetical protein [Micromonospora phytophila]MCM0675254.1 hypothetical protein [Micromonospora phytophila]
MEPGWNPRDYDDEEVEDLLFEAARLYDHVVSGGELQPVFTSVRLDANESAYADDLMEYSRYYALDGYLHQEPVSYLSPMDLIGSAIRNRARREAAEGQWRDTHVTRVVLTNLRLLVFLEGRWLSYWHNAIVQLLPAPVEFCLHLTFHELPPLRLRGPTAASMAVALASLLYPPEQMAQIPQFARFDATAGE